MTTVRRALLSVSDKRDLIPFAQRLQSLGIEILSTGGTCRQLREAGIDAVEVADKTGFPEIMGGRVKTLHPVIHGGLLGRRGTDDGVMQEHGIEPIDLLAVNLYPFEETIARQDATLDDAIENIDIGGPAMIRAASKNHRDVAVVVDPADYDAVATALEKDSLDRQFRQRLAAKAYAHTASYDTAITNYLAGDLGDDAIGERLLYSGKQAEKLRYGENPHQQAAFYRDQQVAAGSLAAATQHQGKALSFNNIADSDAALQCVRQFSQPACVIVKHANPCGVSVGNSILAAYQRAFSTDPTSAFGGIIAFNRRLDAETARAIIDKQFVEVIVAPEIDQQALEALAGKANVRVLETGQPAAANELDIRKVSGGMLVQSADDGMVAEGDLQVVSDNKPTPEQIADMMFAWRVCKHVKSNAIVFAREGCTVGVGAGQMSRVDSARIAAQKARDTATHHGWDAPRTIGAVAASDAFFPFADGLAALIEAGATAVIQPGGSKADDKVIAAADAAGIVMALTGMRHFNH